MKIKVKRDDWLVVPREPYGEEEIYEKKASALCRINELKSLGYKVVDLWKWNRDEQEVIEGSEIHYEWK